MIESIAPIMSIKPKKPQIVGIVLVKNEEKYIKQIISNIVQFCDKIIVADNLSTDSTAEIILDAANKESGKIEYHSIAHPRESHNLIISYAGSKTWIFAVDGDEIYDPNGLSYLRRKIIEGIFDTWWIVLGNVLNCIELDLDKRYARGYLAPPCRSMTKLYNFNVIDSWDGPCPERLHGGSVTFKKGFSKTLRKEIYKEVVWEDAFFRCLHLCFLQRSGQDKMNGNGLFIRKNISDINSEGLYRQTWNKVFHIIGHKTKVSAWKQDKYMRGTLVRKEISSFF